MWRCLCGRIALWGVYRRCKSFGQIALVELLIKWFFKEWHNHKLTLGVLQVYGTLVRGGCHLQPLTRCHRCYQWWLTLIFGDGVRFWWQQVVLGRIRVMCRCNYLKHLSTRFKMLTRTEEGSSRNPNIDKVWTSQSVYQLFWQSLFYQG